MSDYTTRQKLVKQFTGENSGLWGVFLNNNFDRVDFATKGVVAFTLSGTATLTFNNTSTNPANYQAIASTIWITGGTGGTINVPSVENNWNVINDASGSVILTNGSDSVTIAPAARTVVVTDGSSIERLTSEGATTYSTGSSTTSPTVRFATAGTSSFSYTSRSVTWTRVGDRMFVDVNVNFVPTIGTGSGEFQIVLTDVPNLPNASDVSASTPSILSADFVPPSGKTSVLLRASGTNLVLVGRGGGSGDVVFTASNLSNGTTHNLRFLHVYRI